MGNLVGNFQNMQVICGKCCRKCSGKFCGKCCGKCCGKSCGKWLGEWCSFFKPSILHFFSIFILYLPSTDKVWGKIIFSEVSTRAGVGGSSQHASQVTCPGMSASRGSVSREICIQGNLHPKVRGSGSLKYQGVHTTLSPNLMGTPNQ